jgi:DNA-binding NarL/FixJ family response regulator
VVLLDLLMPGIDGVETVRRIIAERPKQGIIMLTAYTGDDKLMQAVQAGAKGYLLKEVSSEELVEAIRSVAQDQPWLSSAITFKLLHSKMTTEKSGHPAAEMLTEREMEVLRLLCLGKTDQEMAKELFLTNGTVRSHVSRILTKLGVSNRVEATLYGICTGVVTLYETEPAVL